VITKTIFLDALARFNDGLKPSTLRQLHRQRSEKYRYLLSDFVSGNSLTQQLLVGDSRV